MEFELNNADNHLQLCALSDAITADGLRNSLHEAQASLEDCPYLLIEMTGVILIEKKAKEMLNALQANLHEQKGLVLMSNLDENLHRGLEIEQVPSLQEAIDLVFMHQLERELEEGD